MRMQREQELKHLIQIQSMRRKQEQELRYLIQSQSMGEMDMIPIMAKIKEMIDNAKERELLRECIARMDEARDHLTKMRPTEMNNWGVLDTSSIGRALYNLESDRAESIEDEQRRLALQRMHFDQFVRFPPAANPYILDLNSS